MRRAGRERDPDRGRDYARIRLLSSLGFAVVSPLPGPPLQRTGYGPAFALCAVLAVALAVAARRAPDVDRADLADHGSGRPRGGSLAVALRMQPRLNLALLAASC